MSRSKRKSGRSSRKSARSSRAKPSSPPPQVNAGGFTKFIPKRVFGVAGGLVLLHLGLCIALFDPKIHFGGDSATYMMLAESITEFSYSLSLDPGPPVPHTKYPAGYPLLLAPLVFLFGRNVVVLKLLSMVFTAGAVLVFRAYVRRGREPLPAFLLALAFAVSPGVIDYSRWMLSEAPFIFFTLLALWMLREDLDRGGGLGRAFWIGLAASVMSFHVRTIGALLLVAGSVSYLIRGEWRRFLAHGSIGAALTIPWLLRTRLATGTTSSYLEEFRLVSIYSPEEGYLDAAGTVGRFFGNGWLYASQELPRALIGSDPSAWSGNALVQAVAVAVCALVVLALVRAFRRRPDAAVLYFVLTCLAIMLFQSVANDVRYLVPLIPLFLMYSMDAATWLGERAKRPAARWLAPASVAGVLVILALTSHAARIPRNLAMITHYALGNPYAGWVPTVANFFEAAAWVEQNTPQDAVVTVRKPRLFNAVTDRRVMMYPFSTDADSVLQAVRDTDYVIIDANFSQTRDYLLPALEANSDEFPTVTVYQTDAPVVSVLRVGNAVPAPEP